MRRSSKVTAVAVLAIVFIAGTSWSLSHPVTTAPTVVSASVMNPTKLFMEIKDSLPSEAWDPF